MSRVDEDWPGEVVAGEQHDPGPVVGEAVPELPAGDGDDAVVQVDVRGVRVDQPCGHVVLAEHLDHALGGTVAGVHDDHPVALAQPVR